MTDVVFTRESAGWYWQLSHWRDDMRVGPFSSEQEAGAHALDQITRRTKEDVQ
jgi:hypothetical protein